MASKRKSSDPAARATDYGLNVEQIRADFPMLAQKQHGKPLIYFDSAATNHKPQVVIDTLNRLYTSAYGKPQENHIYSREMTKAVEETRSKVAKFLGASSREIVFTSGCTESTNIIAQGFGRALLQEGDEIIIPASEHHANIVPWQIACELSGAKIVVAPVTDDGEIILVELQELIGKATRLITLSHSSHVLGTIQPVKDICRLARKHN